VRVWVGGVRDHDEYVRHTTMTGPGCRRAHTHTHLCCLGFGQLCFQLGDFADGPRLDGLKLPTRTGSTKARRMTHDLQAQGRQPNKHGSVPAHHH
jgi:hypothetical protein